MLFGRAVGVLGISPKDFWQMDMWEWSAAMMEYYQANGVKFKDDGQTREEIYEYWLKYGQG